MVNLSNSRTLVAAVLAACTTFFPGVVPADSTRLGIDAEYGHDTNVNRAALAREEQSDDSVSVEAYAARSFLLSARSGIVLRAAVHATQYFDFHDLGSLGVSGRASYRFQPSPGFTNPWIELAGLLDGFKYRDSQIRDGYAASATASVGKYFTDRIRMEAGAGFDRRGGGEGGVYDLSNRKVWTALDYKLTPKTTLYGSATWMEGEQVFTLFNTAAWAPLYASAKAAAADPVFSSAFGGAPTAYRVDAHTNRYELGVNIALRGSDALDFGWSHFDSRADRGGGQYDGDVFRIGYLLRFR
ncbi:MAG TPA: hypothetical protein VKD04_11660 [Burkholderiales bacterium]|nr:hypothetical protein [Burkholderiales bacterium]